jgi:hypothetical protein
MSDVDVSFTLTATAATRGATADAAIARSACLIESFGEVWVAMEEAAWRSISARYGEAAVSPAVFEAAFDDVLRRAARTVPPERRREVARQLRVLARLLRAARVSEGRP